MTKPRNRSASPTAPHAPAGRLSRRPVALVATALLLATFGVYFNSLPAPFVFDDEPAVIDNPTIRNLSALGAVLSPPANGAGVTGRPIVNLSLAVDHALWGVDVRGYRVTNIAIHALGALTLLGLLRRTLMRHHFPDTVRHAALPLAASAALLWALHPLQTETVVCIIQRTESLVSLFYLLALYCFVRAATAGEAPPGPARRDARPAGAWWGAAAVAACLAGMASKEVMVTLPVIALLYDRTFLAGTFRDAWRARWRLHLRLAAGWLLLAALVLGSGGTRGTTVGFGLGVSSFDYLLTQVRAITLYLKLCLWPHPLVVDYGNTVETRLADVAQEFMFVTLLCVASAIAVWRWPRAGFSAAFLFIVLSPSSSVVPLVTQTIAEHRMHLPLAGVLALGVLALHRVLGRFVAPACALLAVAAAVVTAYRNADYLSELGLWLDTVAKAPDSARAHGNLGATYHDLGRHEDSLRHAAESLRLDPTLAQTHYNVGLALEKLGRLDEAVARYRDAIARQPEFAMAWASLAQTFNKLARFNEALECIDPAIRHAPDRPAWHSVRGSALVGLGRFPEAVVAYQAALRIAPDFAEAESNLGEALFQMGRIAEATHHLERAIVLSPRLAAAHFNLGQVAATTGRREKAATHYAEAARLDPAHARARLNLGGTLAELGRLDEALTHLKEAVRLEPASPEAHSNLGLALAQLRRFDEAAPAFEEALRLRPDYATAHLHLGMTLVVLGRPVDAREHFSEALRIDPRLDAAREMLRRLQSAP